MLCLKIDLGKFGFFNWVSELRNIQGKLLFILMVL
jgi:hypothetical protein